MKSRPEASRRQHGDSIKGPCQLNRWLKRWTRCTGNATIIHSGSRSVCSSNINEVWAGHVHKITKFFWIPYFTCYATLPKALVDSTDDSNVEPDAQATPQSSIQAADVSAPQTPMNFGLAMPMKSPSFSATHHSRIFLCVCTGPPQSGKKYFCLILSRVRNMSQRPIRRPTSFFFHWSKEVRRPPYIGG